MADLLIPRVYVLRIDASMKYQPKGLRRPDVMTGSVSIGAFERLFDLCEWQSEFQLLQREYGIKSCCVREAHWPLTPLDPDFDPEYEDGTPDAIADYLHTRIPEHYLREETRRRQELMEAIGLSV